MRKILSFIFGAIAIVAFAETTAISIGNGGAWNADACRLVAIRAASTNATGSIAVKRVMTHAFRWNEIVVDNSITNSVNITTNDVGGYVTNYIMATRSVSCSTSRVTTNTIATISLASNFAVTNFVDGIALMPGDTIIAEGTPMKGGKVSLLVYR